MRSSFSSRDQRAVAAFAPDGSGWRLLVALVLASLGGGCLDAIPPDTVTAEGAGGLTGRITDACDGRALAEVSVVAGKRATTTDGQGRFALTGLQLGPIRLVVSLTEYLSVRPEAVVSEGQTGRIDVALSPVPSKLEPIPLDVLFVVDNSGSMGEEQTALSQLFPEFLSELADSFDDIHVGVVSSDLGAGDFGLVTCEKAGGDDGQLQFKPRTDGCTAPSGPFIRIKEGVATNVDGGDVAEAFSCIVRLGTRGCGFEQPLEAARIALHPDLSPNKGEGFLRDEAMLAVIIITDEDDCSASNDNLFDPSQLELIDPLGPLTSFRCFEFGVSCDINNREQVGPREGCKPAGEWLHPVQQRYIDFFRQLKERPERVFFAAVAGPTSPVEVSRDANNPVVRPSCQSANGVAIPAIRIKAVVDALNPTLSPKPFFSICEPTIPMRSIALQLVTANSFRSCR